MNKVLFDKLLYLVSEHKNRFAFRLLTFPIILAPLILIASFSILNTYRKLDEKAYLHKAHEVNMVSAVIKERVDAFMAISTSLAQRPYLQMFTEKRKWEEAAKILRDIPSTFPYIERIVLYDTNGTIRGEHPQIGVIGEHRREMKWYKDFAKDRKPLLSDVYRRKASPSYNVISAILPIYAYGSNKLVGILMLQVKLEHFYQWLKGYYTNTEFIILLDQQNQVIYHPKLDLQKEIYNYSKHPFIENFRNRPQDVNVVFNPFDKEFRLASYKKIDFYNWAVIVSEPIESAFLERSTEVKKQIITSFIILFFFSLFLLSVFFIIKKNKRIAQQLKEKEEAIFANRAKSEFVSNISHEIRTPLNAILGYTDYLSETTKEKETKDYLGRISKAGQNLLSLINNILELSKIESGISELELQPTSLNTLIEDVVEMLKERSVKKELTLIIDIDPSIKRSFIITDQLKLQRILLNLLGNAIKFSSKGEIKLRAIKQTHETNPTNLIIEIQDQGIGIAAHKIPLLFKRFSQVDASPSKRFEGSGLGLSICKEILDLMGGTITVESFEKKGTTFTIMLPFIETNEAPHENEIAKEITPPCNKSIHILLADDSDENRALIQVYLKAFPYSIDMASNGREAHEKFKKNEYHIVFMDIQMPEIDGLEATKTLRQWEKENQKRKTPIVALTGFALKEEQDRCYKAGCSLHVAKPIKKNELLKIISNYILPKD